MSKRKEPADAFGLSLLDVLSNALGGVILLMLIVAATIKGNDKLRLNIPPEQEQGVDYTALDFDIRKRMVQFDLLLIQIELIGGNATLQLSGEDISNCFISQRMDSNKTSLASNQWLVVRQNKKEKDWSIKFIDNINLPDSISILITLDDAVSCGSKVKVSGNEIVKVRERKSGKPQISIFGKSCI